ncbi:ATP-dependent helicase/deoxyribonuclease subunit B [Enterococcus saigonensis]|uniref:ATP-dependent helicase/deoxyribonuclease subunit B n=1 Tax=Enterococcus saigonensis TaxID=1805431 RepID=A0A679ICH1_9ENTE|nr:PD-(D/E)XK nuclease family protein [Enterococcus saigonensis]BCA85869.1 ATP-dependent helicase/deoxyribonuclease subunit B [Enterococcus saigonensis]
MTLQFLIGNGALDHRQSYIKKAQEWLNQDTENQVFFLVPNYNKFEQEQEILKALKPEDTTSFSTIRAQVFSFYRLAWFYLQKTGQLANQTLSEAGSLMLLQKVLEESKEDLLLYRGEVEKLGFSTKLLGLYQELKVGNLTPEDLVTTLSGVEANADQRLKFAELSLVLSQYEAELIKRELQVVDPLALLTAYLNGENSSSLFGPPDLSKTLFIATDFQTLYAQERCLLTTLAKNGHVLLDLVLDKAYVENPPESLDLFHDTGKIYYQLLQTARENGTKILIDLKAAPSKEDTLQEAVESFWRKTQNGGDGATFALPKESIHLWQALKPTDEVNRVATEIRKLVASGQYRYQDIQILTNDLETYGHLIAPVFNELAIPFYLDQQISMAQHPLVEFLQALFALGEYHYRLSDIMRLLKTELFIPDYFFEEQNDGLQTYRNIVDQTENIALKFNFQGSFWTRKEDWQIIQYDFENTEQEDADELTRQSNRLRRAFAAKIAEFLQRLQKSKTAKEAVEKLYQFLIAIKVDERIKDWREKDIAAGNLELGRNHEQTWSALMALMDDYVEIYGEDPFNLANFSLLFTTGLDSTFYGKVPSAIDQIQLNQLDLARIGQAKITFAIGLNDKNFPTLVSDDSLLTVEDREILNTRLTSEKQLRDLRTESVAKAPFVAYKVFLSACDELFLSYATNHDTEQNLRISPYLQRFVAQGDLKVIALEELTLVSEPENFVSTYRNLVGQLNLLYRLAKDEKVELSSKWRTLENILLSSSYKKLARRAFESRNHINVPVTLPKDVAEKLYGKDLYSSISQMESFYQCSYRYFANYGLRLKERELFGLDALTTGTLFHDALDLFLQAVFAKQKLLVELDEKEAQQLIDTVLQQIFAEPRFMILQSSARMHYLRYRLGKTIKKVIWALHKQSQRTKMTPLATEIIFGQLAGTNGIKGIEASLSTGGKLAVRGKIDRLDTAQSNDHTWLGVIDYKSGTKDFNLTDAYFGLAMQLLTYLDVALVNAAELVGTRDVKAAGAYYMRIHDPVLKAEEASLAEVLKAYKYKGIFAEDSELYPLLDNTLDIKERSTIYPILSNKDGILTKESNSTAFYQAEELELLRQHNRNLMKNAAENIVTGEITLNPYKKNNGEKACNFCPFRSLCGFDVMLTQNDYHEIPNLSKSKILEDIKEENGDA